MITDQTSDLNLENARKRHHEYYAPALSHNAWLRLFCALLCAALIASAAVTAKLWREASHARLIVLNASPTGRLDPVNYVDISGYHPGEKTIRYFAMQWATEYYSRVRYSLAADSPNSWKFLSRDLAQKEIEREDRTRWIEAFQTGADPEIRVTVTNVRLGDWSRQPYHLSVDFRKDFYRVAQFDKSENWTAEITYTLEPENQVSNDLVPVNPLGISIGEIREYQGFGN
jgi:hypothetical protein